MIELKNPIYLNTELGSGYSYWIIDRGPHTDILWGVVMADTGQIVFVPNPKVRVADNYSEGITSESITLKKAPWLKKYEDWAAKEIHAGRLQRSP